MDFMKQIVRQSNRQRWGRGLCVVSRDHAGRLRLKTFATVAAVAEYVEKARHWQMRPAEHLAKFGVMPSRVTIVR